MKKFLLVVFSLFAAGIINAQTRDEQAVEVHFGAYDKSGGGGVNYIWGTRYGDHVFLEVLQEQVWVIFSMDI